MTTEEKYHFKFGEFEGPLDLLLFLIKKAEVSIYDIPIAAITEQYLMYLEYATKIDLDNLTEFYLMAATLLYIKSKMLLPIDVDIEEEYNDPRKELVDRLIDYQKFKKYSHLMAEKEQEAEWVIERRRKQIILPFPEDDELWEKIDIWDLLKTFANIISSLSSERIIDLYEEVSINEKLTLLNELLEVRGEFIFTDLIIKTKSIMEIVCSFLAVLEAVKSKKISIYQNRLFGDIRIKPYELKEPVKEGEGGNGA
ncbi:MAG: segregation/condensation protein A [Spirochaetota bacterium]